jgi:trehalose synthase-fused probable maltokinase
LFRRVEEGPNPDVEIGEFLTERTGFRRAPQLAAWIEYQGAGEAPTHLAVAQQLLPSQADGWSHALAELGRYYDEVGVLTPPPDLLAAGNLFDLAAAAPAAPMIDLAGGYFESAQLLGRRTAELHLALSSDTTAEAFAPQPYAREQVEALIVDAIGQARTARDLLAARRDAIAGETASDAERILARAAEAMSALNESQRAEPAQVQSARTRVHGDYHLGQILWSEGDFYILDFEGEPARPLHERRQTETPMKDVAGMLRSFSYAAYAELFNRTMGRMEEFDRLEPWARAWERWAAASFLKGYLAAAGHAIFVPADPVQRAALLDLLLIDKALYELNYELNNRPEWVRIPLRGLADLLPTPSRA